MVQRLLVNGIDTVGKLANEKRNPQFNNLYLDTHQIYNSIPGSWRRLLTNTSRMHPVYKSQYIGTNRWTENGFKLKDIRTALKQGKEPNNVTEYLRKKHPYLVAEFKNPFNCNVKMTKDVKVRNVQFKILHNIYPTMWHLHKWGIKQTQNCTKCDISETIEHAIFDCSVAKDAIKKFEHFMSNKMGISLSLSLNDVLLGTMADIHNNFNLNTEQKVVIDVCLVLIKQMLILQREEKTNIDEQKLCKCLVDYAKREAYNYKKYKKSYFNHYWHDIMR